MEKIFGASGESRLPEWVLSSVLRARDERKRKEREKENWMARGESGQHHRFLRGAPGGVGVGGGGVRRRGGGAGPHQPNPMLLALGENLIAMGWVEKCPDHVPFLHTSPVSVCKLMK